MSKPTYNLTFWQRLILPFIWLQWASLTKEERLTWHEVKKGMEKHEHKYTKGEWVKANGKSYYMLKCEHEGCNMYDDPFFP